MAIIFLDVRHDQLSYMIMIGHQYLFDDSTFIRTRWETFYTIATLSLVSFEDSE